MAVKEIKTTPGRLSSILQTPGLDRFRNRLLVSIFLISGAFVVLLVRLFYLQVVQGENFRKQSDSNSIRLEYITPARGLIFDRNGTLLVDDRPSFDITIVPKDAKPLDQTLEALSRYVGESPEALMAKIRRKKSEGPFQAIILKSDISRDLLAVIEAHKYDLPGINIEVASARHYLKGAMASHLVGYLSEISPQELGSEAYQTNRAGDAVGKTGVEKAFEGALRGERGGRQVEVNALGRVARVLKTVPGKAGDTLYLTIDEKLQAKAEALLLNKTGAVVAMIPKTGEILAMASSPAFDPNLFVSGLSRDDWKNLSSNPDRPLENKAIQAEYAPASVYKIVMAMAGLEEGVIDENTIIFCSGAYEFGNRAYRCWRWKNGGHGGLNVIQALAQSCDVFFYRVGQQLGVDRIAWYSTASGFGGPTGIDLDHEATGLIPTAAWKKRAKKEPWHPGETLSISIGQGYNLVTPLQVLCMTAAIANGGPRVKPQVVKTIKSPEGEVLYECGAVSVGRLPAGEKTLASVKKGLREVVGGPSGTARAINLKNIEISGKTGTGQVVGMKDSPTRANPQAHLLKDNAWFVAYAPSNDPAIAVSVIVEHGEHGASVSAPIAQEIIRAYLGDTEPVVTVDSAEDETETVEGVVDDAGPIDTGNGGE